MILRQWFHISAFAVLTLLPLSASAETPGKDGPISVSGNNAVLNEYGVVTGSLSAGSLFIIVSSLSTALPSLSVGDLIMIYQAQGATISTADNASYGQVLNYNGAGRYEFQTVKAISGNTIEIETYGSNCAGLSYNYNAGRAQIIRVPQATSLTIGSGSSVTAPNWNGQTGGVVALHVRDTLTLSGNINVTGRGFRGGAVDNVTSPPSISGPAGYRNSDLATGAEKGESIAGFQNDYAGGRYQRGAPANGGGGGNAHNAGGGGGANGDNGVTWNGQGNPDRSVTAWDQAWNIDGTLSATTTSSGGGRGGYTYARDGNALTTAPGDSSWGNDFRREVGGLGGRPLAFDASGRLFFGGGGGAGDGNNNAAGAGGRGGGLVFIIADSVTGSGNILANGQAGENTSPSHNDAPGGGGGGGTVLIKADGLSGIDIFARGGNGGNQLITNNENEGPGGGGGGGVIAFSGGLPSTNNTGGGDNGTTSASSMTEFVPNGATRGASGQSGEAAPSDAALPFCRIPPGKLTATKSVSTWDPTGSGQYDIPGSDIVYSFEIENTGFTPIAAGSIVLEDGLPSDIIFYNDEFDASSAPVTGPITFEDVTGVSGLTCCTASSETAFANSAGGAPSYGYTPATGYDPNVSHIRVTPSGEMEPQTKVEIKFRAKIK